MPIIGLYVITVYVLCSIFSLTLTRANAVVCPPRSCIWLFLLLLLLLIFQRRMSVNVRIYFALFLVNDYWDLAVTFCGFTISIQCNVNYCTLPIYILVREPGPKLIVDSLFIYSFFLWRCSDFTSFSNGEMIR